jgi:hypothetical protein
MALKPFKFTHNPTPDLNGDVSQVTGDVTGFKVDATGMNGHPLKLAAIVESAELDSALTGYANTSDLSKRHLLLKPPQQTLLMLIWCKVHTIYTRS